MYCVRFASRCFDRYLSSHGLWDLEAARATFPSYHDAMSFALRHRIDPTLIDICLA